MGSFASANQACLNAATKGIVRSIEVMTPCAWFPEAAKLINENPAKDITDMLQRLAKEYRLYWGELQTKPFQKMNAGNSDPVVVCKQTAKFSGDLTWCTLSTLLFD